MAFFAWRTSMKSSSRLSRVEERMYSDSHLSTYWRTDSNLPSSSSRRHWACLDRYKSSVVVTLWSEHRYRWMYVVGKKQCTWGCHTLSLFHVKQYWKGHLGWIHLVHVQCICCNFFWVYNLWAVVYLFWEDSAPSIFSLNIIKIESIEFLRLTLWFSLNVS